VLPTKNIRKTNKNKRQNLPFGQYIWLSFADRIAIRVDNLIIAVLSFEKYRQKEALNKRYTSK